MRTRALIPLVAASLCASDPAFAQDLRTPTFGAETGAVIVDVVVRDRDGKPVTDLRSEDFALFEDGVRQAIGDVTLVRPPQTVAGGKLTPGAPGATAHAAPASTAGGAVVKAPTFVALVFDRLSPEARDLAYRGALEYLATSHQGDFAGVFLSDLSLVTVQTFTNDPRQLRAALEDVAQRVTSVFDRQRIVPRGGGDPDPGTPPTAGPESEGPLAGRGGSVSDPGRTRTIDPGMTDGIGLVAMARRMERRFEALARDQQGYATTNSLLAVVSALGELPGRKTVIFFAEGLAIPPNVQAQLQSVVATANRLNVSIYSVDAAGLRVHSGQSETARRVNSIGAFTIERDPEKPDGKLLESLESNEDVLRRDPAVSLRLLAEPTGGFVIDNTNDLARGFRDIDQDRRFHYLLAYIPRNGEFDGEWRSITVQVPTREVQVRARSGYVAVPGSNAIPLLAYEGPALAALGRTPFPREIALRSAALVFPGAAGSRLAILAATDGANLSFLPDEKDQSYRTDFTILARIRNAGGSVVRKASQPYRLTGPLKNIEQARNGGVLFFRQPQDLPAGRYRLEVAVHDAFAERAGVSVRDFVVPASTPGGLSVSSLIVVRRGERVPESEVDPGNPLFLRDVLIYPNLGTPIQKGEKAVTLFISVAPGAGALPTASLEVLRGGQRLATLPVALDAPDAAGRIRQLARLPTAALTPGDYALRLTVESGGRRERREASFQLVD